MNDNLDSFRDRLATVDDEGKRKWVYATQPQGRFYNWRTWVSWGYLLFFLVLPFLKINGNPLFMINILERRFILFSVVFWPQDFFIFMLGMLTFVLFVVLFTVVFGRVFCGWVCPQTIFMEMVFRKIEYWIEGDAMQQHRIRNSPWNKEKIIKRGGKLLVFFIVSFIIANYFLAYIIGVDELSKIIFEPLSMHVGSFAAIIFFTTAFFLVYSFAREQICTIVCPYGRLQGVMLDKNSVVVAYDYKRGEQRAKLKKNEARASGDCVDCGLCVRVCPTGIDIRNGTQMECINCTACIDACDSIMDHVGFKRGLIKYASENNIVLNEKLHFTTRMKAYSFVLLVLVGILVTLLSTRQDIDATVLRVQGQLFQEQEGNKVSNLYNIELINKTHKDIPVELKLENMNGEIKLVGHNIVVKKEAEGLGTFFVYRDTKKVTSRKTKFKVGIYQDGKRIATATTSFFGPVNH